MSRVLLVNMPWMNPSISSLALATLRPLLERGGIEADCLYGNLLFPRTSTDSTFLDRYASFLFLPAGDPSIDVDVLVQRITERYLDDLNLHGLAGPNAAETAARYGVTAAQVGRELRGDIERARVCLERCFERACRPEYDVIGFTATFESQLPAVLALARRLEQARPELKIMLGGAACFEDQGEGLAGSFATLDAVCHCEGEDVVVKLVRALRGELALSEVPGIAWRDDQGVLRKNPSPPPLEDLDRLPVPDYHDYLAQLAASEWAGEPPKLMFETSRGCWWGQKHLCTFCGLNAEGLAFRVKSADRAFTEIAGLYRDYPAVEHLQATDNILEPGYLKTVLPALARMAKEPARPLKIFYEIKSNLKAAHLRLLSAAGVKSVQPGIESFSDNILQVMDKGCTGLGQVQFLKWAYQEGLQPVYNLLVANPGERAEDYEEMLELLPYITHLPPPSGIAEMALERFSPYFDRSESFGISNKRPKPYYAELYPEPGVDLERIAYHFDYEHAMRHDEPLRQALSRFAVRAMRWTRNWQTHRAFFVDRGDHLVIIDRRDGFEVTHRLQGVAAEVYRYIDAVRTFDAIARKFPALDQAVLRGLLERWHALRWSFTRARDDRHLALLPRVYERPHDVEAVIAEVATSSGGETAAKATPPRLQLQVVA